MFFFMLLYKTNKCSIQLGYASLNGTFHLSPHENICTIALINIHYLYNIDHSFAFVFETMLGFIYFNIYKYINESSLFSYLDKIIKYFGQEQRTFRFENI